jgi:hypothetical protein
MLEAVRVNAALQWLPSAFWSPDMSVQRSAELLEALRRDHEKAGLDAALTHSEGHLLAARGDAAAAVHTLAPLIDSRAPAPVRLSAARLAAQGAWLGTVPLAVADSVLARTSAAIGPLTGTDAIELAWVDAVVAIAAEDSLRFARARGAIHDSTAFARSVRRVLGGLWRERRHGAVDSLLAAEDDAMLRSTTFTSALPLSRSAIGRALVRSGEPERAERYLQWTDAIPGATRAASVFASTLPYVSYERGLAREAAGDRQGAMLHYQRFVEMMDQPVPAMRQQVEDAKARLARLKAR